MLYKKFLSIALNTVSVLALSGMLLTSDFIPSSQAMEVEKSQQTGTKRTRSGSNAQNSLPKRQRRSSTSPEIVPVKEEPAPSRGLLTKEDLDEKVKLVNPRNGTHNCAKCNVSGYLMLKYQLSTPKKVNTKADDHANNNSVRWNRNQKDIDYLDPEKISLLPSGRVQLTLAENEESWTEEFCIEDSKPITFQVKFIDEFYELLKTMEFNQWNNGRFQAGLLILPHLTNPSSHMLTFYSYQLQDSEQVNLLLDFQWKEVFPVTDFEEYMKKWGFSSPLYVWYDAPGFQPLGERHSPKQESDDSISPLSSPFSGENENSENSTSDHLLNDVIGIPLPAIGSDGGNSTARKTKRSNSTSDPKMAPKAKRQKVTESHDSQTNSSTPRKKRSFGRKTILPDDIEEMKTLASEGLCKEDIAQKIGCSVATVDRHVKTQKKKPIRLTEAYKTKIEDLATKGWTQEDIAKDIGLATNTVGSYLRKKGLVGLSKKKPSFSEKEVALILKLKAEGLTHKDIGKELGCSAGPITSFCELQGMGKFKRLTPTQIDEIKELARSGKTSAELAEQFGCNPGTIDKHLQKEGLENPGKRFSHLIPEKIERLKELAALGWKHQDIADELGCDRTNVGKQLKALGLSTKKTPKRITDNDIKTMKTLSAEGKTQKEIAQVIGCNFRVVGQYLRKVGVVSSKKLPGDKIGEIENYEKEGKSRAEIGKILEISPQAVLYHQRKKLQPLSEQPKTPTIITEDDEQEMKRLTSEGLTPKEIGEHLNCSEKRVRERLKKMNITPARHRKVLTEEAKKQIRELADQDLSLREIGRQVGSSHGVLGKYLTTIGVEIKDKKLTEKQKLKITDLGQDPELTHRKIAEIVGCHPGTVRRYLEGTDAPQRVSGKRLSEEEHARIVTLSQRGKSPEEIAIIVGCTPTTARKHLAKEARLQAEQKNLTEDEGEELNEMFAELPERLDPQ